MSRYKYTIATALAALAALLLAAPVLAAYYADITVTESDGISYDMLPVSASIDVDYLATNGFIETDGRDVRVKTASGADVPFMLVDDKTLYASSIGENRGNAFRLSTGNSLIDGFSIVTGYGGYITIADHANLELGNDFEIEIDTWLDVSIDTAPAVEGTAASIEATEVTSHDVELPSDIQNGELLLMLFSCYDSGSTTPDFTNPTGWTILEQDSYAYGCWFVAYRIADGGEGSTVTVTTDETVESAHQTFRISNYTGLPEVDEGSQSGTSTPNPPSLTPSWKGITDTLWLAIFLGGKVDSRTLSSYPTDYSDGQFTASGSTTNAYAGSARRELQADSENPSSFTLSGEINATPYTIAIRNAATIVWKKAAFALYIDDTVLKAVMLDSPAKTVSKSGLSDGEYEIKVYADGTDLKLDIDGSTEDTEALSGTSVPDNANDWILSPTYFNYYKHTTSDTLRLTYEPDDILIGTTLPNELAAGTYDGVITYGSAPSGISVAVGGLETTAVSYPTDGGASQDIIRPTTAPLFDVNLERLEYNPLRPVVVLIATEVNLTERLVWLGGGFFILFAVLFVVLWKSEGQITFTAFGGIGVCIVMYLLGIFPLWPTIVFSIGAVASFIWERVVAL